MMPSRTTCTDLNVLVLVKPPERFVFLWRDTDRDAVLRVMGRFASNPELSLTWGDVAVLAQKVHEMERGEI
jgi:hypothetical protein